MGMGMNQVPPLGISKELLDEFREILKTHYDLDPSEAEASEMAQNILNFYRTLERLSNYLP